jgi:preprotein translocase subunit SecA
LINVKVIDSQEQDNNFAQKQNKKFNELSTKKIGRNELCPCNSGKKYKHCCGTL